MKNYSDILSFKLEGLMHLVRTKVASNLKVFHRKSFFL